MWTKEGTKWCPYCPQYIAPQIWPCLAFSHIPCHIPHHWNMLKEWCKMMSLMFGFIWPWYFTPVMTWFFGNFIMLYLCLKQYFANICTSLSLFGFTWICLYFSDFWDLYATCPSKTAFCRYIHNVSYFAVFGFATVIFLWSHNFFQIFPNFLEFFMLHFMLIQYFVNILCYALFALVGFAVI